MPVRATPATVPEANFWAVFECAPDAYLLLAADPPRFTMVAANETRLRLTMTRREDVIGRPLFEVFPDNPNDPTATGVRNLQASLHEVLRTGKPHRMALQKYDIRRPDGEFEERYWDPLNSPVFDEHGNVIYIIHRVEDVTHAVRSGSRLRILESVVTTANDAVVVTDPDPVEGQGRRIVYVNEAFTRMTGYTREEVVGKTPRILQGPGTDPAALDRIHAALERRQPVRVELLNYRKDGSPFWVELSITPVLDESGSVVHWTSVQRETTERRQAEELALRLAAETAARAEEAKARAEIAAFRTVAELANDAYVFLDEEGRILWANRLMAERLGFSADELRTLHLWDFDPIFTKERYQELFHRARAGRVAPFESENIRRDGSRYPIEVTATVVELPEGLRLFAAIRDITERKAADTERERLLAREREAREQVTTILESITDAFFAVDREWRFTYVNREAERLLQRPRGELLGKNLWTEFPGAIGATFEREYQHAMANQVTVHFEELYPPLGIWFDVRAYPSTEGLAVYFHDVTARKLAEEKLRASEERYRLLADLIPQHIWTTGPSGYHSYFSKRWFDYTGARLEDTEGEGWLQYLHPDDRERTLERWQHSLRTGEPYSIEYRFRGADGEYRWFWGQAVPLRDEAGNTIEWFGTLTDISERKRLDEERERLLALEREAREQVTTILESITDAFFAVDRDWRFRYVNREAERLLKRSREELIGLNIWDEFPKAATAYREYHRAVEEQTTIRFEEFSESLGIWVDVRAYPTADGLAVFFRDVTARKEAEENLRASERNFRALANSIPQLAWMAEPNGWISWYNDRWFEYTGTTFEEMQGWGWQKVHHPEHVDRVVERIRRAFETGQNWEDTFPLRGKNGEYRWFLSRAVPIRDARGNVVRWFGTNTDITESIEAAAERERLLEREREARAEADRERENLERVTESRAGLIRGFSHDVRNPLTVADMTTQLLEVGGLSEEEYRESVKRIRRSIRSSLRLIDDLLDVARAEAGQLEIERVTTDVGQIAHEATDDFTTPAAAVGIDLDVRAPRGLEAETDPARLRQILSNLLSNAVKYAPRSRVTVDAEIRDSGPRPGEWIAVSVADTGPGIPEDKREAVFQEYTRLDPEAQQGAGIGLAISRRIARLLGGDLTVESDIGRGATFTLWLPR